MTKHATILSLMIAGWACTMPISALAQPATETTATQTTATAGKLDPNFGSSGKELELLNKVGVFALPESVSVKLQRDGKIVISAPIYSALGLARFLPNGQLDPSFGSGGVAFDTAAKIEEAPQDLAIQPDGRIVAVGGAAFSGNGAMPGGGVVLTRFNANGSLDTTFGSGGEVSTLPRTNAQETANVVLLQTDGKIVIGGISQLATRYPPPPQAILQRYNRNGSLDATFGSGGKVLFSLPGSNITALALQTDGKIITNIGAPFVRVLPNGIIDTSHAPGTIAATAHTGPGTFLLDGRYVLTGSVPDGSSGDVDVKTVRFLQSGTVDHSFASPVFDFGKQVPIGTDVGMGIALQADGKVLVGGFGPPQYPGPSEFGLARLATSGSLDQGFGRAGSVITLLDQNYGNGTSAALVVQPDGKILAVGPALNGGADGVWLIRYLP